MKSPEFEQQSNITIEQVDFSQPESLKKFAEIGDEWPDYTASIKKLADSGRAISFVAESGGETAGIATLMLDGWEKDQIVLDNFPGLPELNGLQIKEEFRGQGIGTELTEKLEDKARELGIETVGLGVEVET